MEQKTFSPNGVSFYQSQYTVPIMEHIFYSFE